MGQELGFPDDEEIEGQRPPVTSSRSQCCKSGCPHSSVGLLVARELRRTDPSQGSLAFCSFEQPATSTLLQEKSRWLPAAVNLRSPRPTCGEGAAPPPVRQPA